MKCSKPDAKKMITTVNLLDMLKAHHGSDYKTAKVLNVTGSRITQMRNHGGVFTDQQGIQAAEILDLPKDWVLVSLAAERALNGPVFDILTHAAEKLDTRKVSSFAVLALIPLAMAFSNIPLTGA